MVQSPQRCKQQSASSGATAHCVHRRQNKKTASRRFFKIIIKNYQMIRNVGRDTLEDFPYEKIPTPRKPRIIIAHVAGSATPEIFVNSNEFSAEETLNPVISS